MSSTRVPEAVKRIFTETFTARDIAEPLASFDDDAPSEQVAAFMRDRGLQVVGVRREGAIVGYVRRSTLDGATCGDKMTPLDEAMVVDDSESLLKTLTALEFEPLILIRAGHGVRHRHAGRSPKGARAHVALWNCHSHRDAIYRIDRAALS